MSRSIGVLIYPGFELLDAAGPISAFGNANLFAPEAYSISVFALKPGPVVSDSGAAMYAPPLPMASLDTLIVVGGMDWRVPAHCAQTMAWFKTAARRARRVTSVCTGAFVLAEAGLLNGHRATTHWNYCAELARCFPQVRVEPDRIFINRDKVWTSAGVTAGIDLALALIGEDLGEDVARRTAQELVVYHRRPGGQSQLSALIEMDRQDGRFAKLLDWMRSHLSEPLTINHLADQAAMSPRHFSRAFAAETGLTPAKAVERLRVEAARVRVESSSDPIDHIGIAVGFTDPERMRRAFVRAFGQPPQSLRRAARGADSARH
ncbi:AraC family transcriptional regulator [Paramesorhizobium deserti]|uniref:AraC family transcriptional regulator n=1 Tax=Paramesorhizobium deserti TaxID=1494590 RepID=A0A135HNH3_9HYPH|nr:GlxA family transcriptional regulator [Paramesorhizobium deserti]KXF74761.1 AraC family transcriptional regulator [Paramesorhizobium deserti]